MPVSSALRTFARHARLEPAHSIEPPGLARRWDRRGQRLRHHHVRLQQRGEAESTRQHADDHRACRTQLDRPRQRFRIGSQIRTPELLADERDRRRALPCIAGLQEPPEHGLHAQRVERVRRHGGAFDQSRLTVAVERGLEAAIGGQGLQRALALSQIHEVAERDVGLREPRLERAVPQHDELAGAVERQRPQQSRFNDGEERGVGADPQGQGQDRGRRKGRFPPEDPQRLAHVMGLHGLLGRGIRGGCLVRGRGETPWGREVNRPRAAREDVARHDYVGYGWPGLMSALKTMLESAH
jgi:hypothetical protein